MLKQKPSMKIKRRYILISRGNEEEVKKIIMDYIGILGYAKAAPVFVKNEEDKIILAVEVKSLNNIRSAFEISESKLKILKVSGTIKGLLK